MCVDLAEADPTFNTLNNNDLALSWDQNTDSPMYDLLFVNDLDKPYEDSGIEKDSEKTSAQQEVVFTSMPTPPPFTITSLATTLSPHTIPGLQYAEAEVGGSTSPRPRGVDPVRPDLARGAEENPLSYKGTSTQNVDQREEKCIQRLSNLSCRLSTQSNRFAVGPPAVTLDVLISPVDGSGTPKVTPVDNILNSTREYLDILKLLRNSSQASHDSPTTDFSINSTNYDRRENADADRTHRSVNASSSTKQTSTDNSSISPNPYFSANKRPGTSEDLHLDTTTLLLLTTCCVHILRLFVALFYHVEIFLTEIASSDSPYLWPIPKLSFGAFSIGESNLPDFFSSYVW